MSKHFSAHQYTAITIFTVLIRLAIITVTVIPAVILIITYAINAVTVISENGFYLFRVCLFVYVPARGKFCLKITVCHFVDFPAGGEFCEKKCFCYFKKLRSIEKRRYLDGFEPQEYARTLSFEKL